MDEKSMILEQERLTKEKKRKKYKKIKVAVGILSVLVVAGGIFYVVKGREMLAASQMESVEIVAKEGQTIQYAQIVSIYGNEITYIETQMPQMDVNTQTEQKESTRETSDRGQRPEGFGGFGGGEMPEGFGGFGGGEMPEGFGGFGGGEMPEGFGGFGGSRGDSSNSQRQDMPGRNSGGMNVSDQITAYIPVGTQVITKLGTTTTFSRLAAGDYIALVIEEENDEQIIMAVYIVG